MPRIKNPPYCSLRQLIRNNSLIKALKKAKLIEKTLLNISETIIVHLCLLSVAYLHLLHSMSLQEFKSLHFQQMFNQIYFMALMLLRR